jgi:hypothetical protein
MFHECVITLHSATPKEMMICKNEVTHPNFVNILVHGKNHRGNFCHITNYGLGLLGGHCNALEEEIFLSVF